MSNTYSTPEKPFITVTEGWVSPRLLRDFLGAQVTSKKVRNLPTGVGVATVAKTEYADCKYNHSGHRRISEDIQD